MAENDRNVVTGVTRHVMYTGRYENLDGCNTCVLHGGCIFGNCPCGDSDESFVDLHLIFRKELLV